MTYKTFHHYTHSEWADGAAVFAADQLKEQNFELVIINKDIGAWETYIFQDGEARPGRWNYGPIPSSIGVSVWLHKKL